MMVLRVLIVDDSAMMRSFLRECLASDPAIEVVGVASDPFSARQKIKALNPHVITLDIEMPGMDGLTFLEHLMRLRPMPVVMVSSLTQRGAATTLRALEIGAVDFIGKPSEGLETGWPDFRAEIIAKVKTAATALVPFEMPRQSHLALSPETKMPDCVVALGGSTGSVAVLQHIIAAMPADGPAMLVVVHMPAQFTRQFATRLDGICAMTVLEAVDGMKLQQGHAYVAPGDRHLTIRRFGSGYTCRLENGPRVNGHVPSVDVLFESMASAAGKNAIGVILTGMGKDGSVGLRAMRDSGALTACQDEATSLIYGMPGAAVACGAVCDELALAAIPGYILRNASSARVQPEKAEA
jgi:two-component system, chemotaxis family, protein-glutamate methylesterase/glutaminase